MGGWNKIIPVTVKILNTNLLEGQSKLKKYIKLTGKLKCLGVIVKKFHKSYVHFSIYI